ncbi:MAG: septum site-determining protein MinC [Coprobacillus sp.]
MLIEVKGVNDILVMKVTTECDFDFILNELDTLLEQPIFNQDGYYPRAFFDFGCRHLKEEEISKLLELLQRKKKVIFDGISLPHTQNEVEIKREQLRNGEEVVIYNETLFLGIVNPGSYVYCYDDVYFLNTVKGTIIAMNENIKIFGHDFQNAQIVINQQTMQDLTTSALSSVYYNDDNIIVNKEDGYEPNYCYNFG